MTGIQEVLENMKKAFMNKKPMPEKPKEFPCFRCNSTGIIFTVEDGVTKAAVCPDCAGIRRTAQYMKKSGISKEDYARYTMDTFLPDTDEAKKMKACALRFLNDPKATGIGFFGKSGSGKTHMCVAICQALGKPHRYWQYRQRIQEIKAVMYQDERRYNELMNEARYAPYLYIDDLFKDARTVVNGVYTINTQDLQIMFDIIDTRYMKKLPTIVSSEYQLSDITRVDEAIGGRLYEMLSPYINRTTENRRLRNLAKIDIMG